MDNLRANVDVEKQAGSEEELKNCARKTSLAVVDMAEYDFENKASILID